MTFSLVCHDADTGSFGSVICSSSPSVAARCVHLRDGVGSAHSQNITDPRIGTRLLDLMEGGLTASEAIDRVSATDSTMPYRQLLAVDRRGGSAVHSGPRALGVVGTYTTHGAAAAGNLLASDDVPRAMVDAWLSSTGEIEQRLLAAFAAAMKLGGEAGDVHSAGLTVVSGHRWATTDLRVDWSDDPLGDMRTLVDVWLPQRDDYIVRAEDPARSPGFGVAGDDR